MYLVYASFFLFHSYIDGELGEEIDASSYPPNMRNVSSENNNDDQDVVMDGTPLPPAVAVVAAMNPSSVSVNLPLSTQETVEESSHTEGPLKKKRRVSLISVEPATTIPEKEVIPVSVGEAEVDREVVKAVEVVKEGEGMIIIED
jgi:hypothetical protein